jgi:hypothetical protein
VDFAQFVILITRTGATAQLASALYLANGGGVFSNSSVLRTAPAETLSGAVVIDFRGLVVSGGTFRYDTLMIENLGF